MIQGIQSLPVGMTRLQQVRVTCDYTSLPVERVRFLVDRGGGASGQLRRGEANIQNTPHQGGMLPQENFEFARSEIESGAIWRHLKPSTHIVKLSYLLALEQRTRSRVRRCLHATVCATVRLQR